MKRDKFIKVLTSGSVAAAALGHDPANAEAVAGAKKVLMKVG